jgi:hypothetical protein
VSGFGQNTHQFIDFTAIGSAGASVSYTSTSSDGGVLTVSRGGSAVASIDLVGHYTSASFHISSGTGGGVEVVDPPVVAGGWPSLRGSRCRNGPREISPAASSGRRLSGWVGMPHR